MSECVVRMEMPEGCWDCPCVNGEYGYCQADEENRPIRDPSEMPSWCPIVCQLPERHGRLIDADAYSVEMKDRQEAAWKWRNEAIAEEDEVKLARAEGAFTAFTEAKLTMDKHIISPWHRVGDELPEKFVNVILANKRGKHYDIDKGWWNGYSFDRCAKGIYRNVTHWMPLPEPPKEDSR